MGCGAGTARTAAPAPDADTRSPASTDESSTAEALKLEVDTSKEAQVPTISDEQQTTPAEPISAALGSLRKRLISMGQLMAIEVAPANVDLDLPTATKSASPGPKKLLQLQAEFIAQGKPPVLRDGTPVFVNMVKTSMEHFADVSAASQALAAAGLSPCPHLPAARFATVEDCRSTMKALAGAGASQLLVIGGNDLQEQLAAEACIYSSGACGLLQAELGSLRDAGVKSVAVAGHPDGHPGLSWDQTKSGAVLLEKAKLLLEAGFDVVVATQFCFDARKLVSWLQTSRDSLLAVRTDILASGKPCGTITFCVGVPGPTPMKKLEKIAQICEVPSLFISSAFDVIDSDQDGVIAWEDFQKAVQTLGLSRRSTTKLASFWGEHADEDGLLRPDGFSNMLLDDAISRRISFGPNAQRENVEGKEVSGPSKFVNDTGDSKLGVSGPSAFVGKNGGEKTETSRIVWPDELILTLAAYCERCNVQAGEVMLHFYPFGGLARTFDLLSELQSGTWPKLSNDSVCIS